MTATTAPGRRHRVVAIALATAVYLATAATMLGFALTH